MNENPCKDCTARHVGCHGDCDRYKEWKAAHDQQKEEQRKHKVQEYAFQNYKVGVRTQAKKRARMQKESAKW